MTDFWHTNPNLRDEAERLRNKHLQSRHYINGHDGEPLNVINPTVFEGLPVPQRRWLVTNWIPLGRVTGLYGAGGEGKTLVAQMLATSCAIGQSWLGLPTLPCNSVLHYCEDDEEELRLRQQDINDHYGCSYRDLGAIRWVPRLGYDNALMTFETGRALHTKLFYELLAVAKAHEARLVITDTLADVFTGDENHRGQARAFTQQTLGYLARELRGAVIVLAHPSRAGVNSGSGESGSTGWVGTVRVLLYLSTPTSNDGRSEPTDPNLRTLAKKKINAGRRDELELRWQNGVLVPTKPQSTIDRAATDSRAERVFLALLRSTYVANRWCSASPKAGAGYAPNFFMTLPEREGVTRGGFETAMNRLIDQQRIRIEAYGRQSDPRYRLAPCYVDHTP